MDRELLAAQSGGKLLPELHCSLIGPTLPSNPAELKRGGGWYDKNPYLSKWALERLGDGCYTSFLEFCNGGFKERVNIGSHQTRGGPRRTWSRPSVFYLRRCQLFHFIAWAYVKKLTNTSTSPSGPCRRSDLKHPISLYSPSCPVPVCNDN